MCSVMKSEAPKADQTTIEGKVRVRKQLNILTQDLKK